MIWYCWTVLPCRLLPVPVGWITVLFLISVRRSSRRLLCLATTRRPTRSTLPSTRSQSAPPDKLWLLLLRLLVWCDDPFTIFDPLLFNFYDLHLLLFLLVALPKVLIHSSWSNLLSVFGHLRLIFLRSWFSIFKKHVYVCVWLVEPFARIRLREHIRLTFFVASRLPTTFSHVWLKPISITFQSNVPRQWRCWDDGCTNFLFVFLLFSLSFSPFYSVWTIWWPLCCNTLSDDQDGCARNLHHFHFLLLIFWIFILLFQYLDTFCCRPFFFSSLQTLLEFSVLCSHASKVCLNDHKTLHTCNKLIALRLALRLMFISNLIFKLSHERQSNHFSWTVFHPCCSYF